LKYTAIKFTNGAKACGEGLYNHQQQCSEITGQVAVIDYVNQKYVMYWKKPVDDRAILLIRLLLAKFKFEVHQHSTYKLMYKAHLRWYWKWELNR
jgi:hypothetical protein